MTLRIKFYHDMMTTSLQRSTRCAQLTSSALAFAKAAEAPVPMARKNDGEERCSTSWWW